MYINRSIENTVLEADRDFKAVLVTGARQTGKSTLLRHLFTGRDYVSFDDPFIEDQAKNASDMFMMFNPPPVILDEVQRVPELFRYIKMQCDGSEKRGLYALSGSQPFRLMQNVSESLSGRVAVIEMLPLSLREITGSDFNSPFLPTVEYVMQRRASVVRPENIWSH